MSEAEVKFEDLSRNEKVSLVLFLLLGAVVLFLFQWWIGFPPFLFESNWGIAFVPGIIPQIDEVLPSSLFTIINHFFFILTILLLGLYLVSEANKFFS